MAAHWSDAYVGRPWVEGRFDCANMACAVQAEVFGRRLGIPTERDYLGLAGLAKLRAMRGQLRSLKDDYADRIDEAAAQEGDGVLLIGRGKPDHIGILCLIDGARWVLHAAAGPLQVVRTRWRELGLYGYAIEGCYRWK